MMRGVICFDEKRVRPPSLSELWRDSLLCAASAFAEATARHAGSAMNMRFCETNPPVKWRYMNMLGIRELEVDEMLVASAVALRTCSFATATGDKMVDSLLCAEENEEMVL